jgi:hypothetical protein
VVNCDNICLAEDSSQKFDFSRLVLPGTRTSSLAIDINVVYLLCSQFLLKKTNDDKCSLDMKVVMQVLACSCKRHLRKKEQAPETEKKERKDTTANANCRTSSPFARPFCHRRSAAGLAIGIGSRDVAGQSACALTCCTVVATAAPRRCPGN